MEMERSRFTGYRRIAARGRHITLTRNGNRDRSFPRHAALGPYDVLKLLPESEVHPIRRSRSEAMG
jgi:hypothetical protein